MDKSENPVILIINVNVFGAAYRRLLVKLRSCTNEHDYILEYDVVQSGRISSRIWGMYGLHLQDIITSNGQKASFKLGLISGPEDR
jgi:hypothetical protein